MGNKQQQWSITNAVIEVCVGEEEDVNFVVCGEQKHMLCYYG